jgi:hypothetical protein
MSDENVTYLKPEYALFSKQVRQNLAASLSGGNPDTLGGDMATVDRLEQVLCTEIMRFFRAVFVKLASRAGEALGKKIVG